MKNKVLNQEKNSRLLKWTERKSWIFFCQIHTLYLLIPYKRPKDIIHRPGNMKTVFFVTVLKELHWVCVKNFYSSTQHIQGNGNCTCEDADRYRFEQLNALYRNGIQWLFTKVYNQHSDSWYNADMIRTDETRLIPEVYVNVCLCRVGGESRFNTKEVMCSIIVLNK